MLSAKNKIFRKPAPDTGSVQYRACLPADFAARLRDTMRVLLLLIPVCFLAACSTPDPAGESTRGAGGKRSKITRHAPGSLAAFQ
jgi:hypothetical protein